MADAGASNVLAGNQILLTAHGIQYGGWTRLMVRRSLEELAHSFRVELVDQWSPLSFGSIPIVRGDAVNVSFFDGTVTWPLVTGFVDETTLSYDKESHTLGFSGRSLTCDLVDCSAAPMRYLNATLSQIATSLLSPFNLSFTFGPGLVDGPPFPVFAVTDGDTVFNTLEKLCRNRGFVMTTDGTGNLVFDRVGSTKVATTLAYGQNVLQCQSKNSATDRFSTYTVKSQASSGGPGGDAFYGKAATQKVTSTDPHVIRTRPLTIQAESGEVGTALLNRALWEASVRAGRGDRTTYTVNGWDVAAGKGPWEPNTLVHVEDPLRRVIDDLLIVSATQTRDDSGTHTQLELCEPTAFTPQPLVDLSGGVPL